MRLFTRCALAGALLLTLMPRPVLAGHSYAWRYLGVYRITGYTWTGDRTATGVWPELGRTVAVDPSLIPLHSRVRIADLGVHVAEDTGAFRGALLDVYVGSDGEAESITSWRKAWIWRR